MPAINVNIQPEVIHWALSQTQESKLGDKLMKILSIGLMAPKRLLSIK